MTVQRSKVPVNITSSWFLVRTLRYIRHINYIFCAA